MWRSGIPKLTVRSTGCAALPRRLSVALGTSGGRFSGQTRADDLSVTISGVTSYKEIQTGEKQTIVIGEGTKSVTSLGASMRYVKNSLFTPGLTARLLGSYTSGRTLVTDTAYRAHNWDGTWVKSALPRVTRREKSIRHYDKPRVTLRANFSYDRVCRSHRLQLPYERDLQ